MNIINVKYTCSKIIGSVTFSDSFSTFFDSIQRCFNSLIKPTSYNFNILYSKNNQIILFLCEPNKLVQYYEEHTYININVVVMYNTYIKLKYLPDINRPSMCKSLRNSGNYP